MQDIALHVGERGLLLGMTRYGKSTLAEFIIEQFRKDYPHGHVVILDTKPRFRGERELSGLSAAHRYREWDWGEVIPGSVVLPLHSPRSELQFAWSQGYKVVIAQIKRRSEILTLDSVVQWAYEDRKKNIPLLFYFDETNNFFRTRNGNATVGFTMAITSGGERSVAVLAAAQRPAWIGIEAMESMTKLYGFYIPYGKDLIKLQDMGVPANFKFPEVNQKYVFSFFDRNTMIMGQGMMNYKKKGKASGRT